MWIPIPNQQPCIKGTVSQDFLPLFLLFSSKSLTMQTHTIWTLQSGLGIRSLLIRSDRSNQMSNCEQFTQIAQVKWVTVSESLRLLISKEQLWANCSGCLPKMSNVSESLRLLTKNERMSELLVFLSKSLIRSFFRKKLAIPSVDERIPNPVCNRLSLQIFKNSKYFPKPF